MQHGRRFHVSVHDVAPFWSAELAEIFAALTPLIGQTLAAAVVPSWHGSTLSFRDGAFLSLVEGNAAELLLHGWSHDREGGCGLRSLVTGGADEFSSLAREECRGRLRRGRELLTGLLGRPVDGFLAPAFQMGAIDADVLATAGLAYRVGWSAAVAREGHSLRLATRMWDVSPVAALGWAGEAIGRLALLRPGALPTIVIHPADVSRGFLPRAVAGVRALLAAGGTPVLLGDLLAAGRAR